MKPSRYALNLIFIPRFMRAYIFPVILLFSALFSSIVSAQTIQGQIVTMDGGQILQGVTVRNIYTGETLNSDEKGNFAIGASQGQLVEFSKPGYRIQRVRIPQGHLPVFKVNLETMMAPVTAGTTGAAPDYETDSQRYYQLYKHELEFEKLTGLKAIQHPFSALSKRNQEVWAFQDNFKSSQQQKYIDYNFNTKLVAQLTGLQGDSADAYVRMFRPTYEQLRSMNEYTRLLYVKRTVALYRERGIRARMAPSRSAR